MSNEPWDTLSDLAAILNLSSQAAILNGNGVASNFQPNYTKNCAAYVECCKYFVYGLQINGAGEWR